jgi:hypothetical protein
MFARVGKILFWGKEVKDNKGVCEGFCVEIIFGG